MAGLQAERDGLKNQLSALQSAHAEAQQSSQRKADRLTKVHLFSPSSSCNKPCMAPFLLESLADLGVGASADLINIRSHKLLSDASQPRQADGLWMLQEMQALAAELASLQAQHEQHSAASKREADSLFSSR